ncbi:MAG: response regulator [Bdellovibrionales bacterium]|nr:response regulator [Bdellovibrionales bacterium]MCB0335160.1 response regulator [Bdellovibrionales bacterium]
MALRIFLIDDDQSFRQLVKLKLKSFLSEPQFTEFSDLSSARDHFSGLAGEDQIPDLVFLDEHLPDGRGTDLLEEEWFTDLAVLSVSSDEAPEIPGKALKAGATYFLSKKSITEPLFEPLVRGVIDRNKIQKELTRIKVKNTVIDLVRTHIGTLRHEINNPLGAVLGAAYLIEHSSEASKDQREAAQLVEKSGKRIKHVLDQICIAMDQEKDLQPVMKADQQVYHIPGDEPWENTTATSTPGDLEESEN